jgi:hypothetical protein
MKTMERQKADNGQLSAGTKTCAGHLPKPDQGGGQEGQSQTQGVQGQQDIPEGKEHIIGGSMGGVGEVKFPPLRLRGGAGESPSPSRDSSDFRTVGKLSDLETVSFESESDESLSSEEFQICEDPRFVASGNEKIDFDLGAYEFDSDSDTEIVEFESLRKEQPMTDLTGSTSGSMLKACCNLKCNEDISDEIKEVMKLFADKSKTLVKNELLTQLHHQRRMGLSVKGFFFSGKFLCHKTFQQLSGLSPYIVNAVLDAFRSGLIKFEHGNSGMLRQSPALINFICWMLRFSDLYGQAAPDELLTVLPNFLKVKDLFEIYLDEAEKPQVKESTFYRLFDDHFGPGREDKKLPCIRIRANSSHSRCDQCIALASFQRTSKTEEQLAFAKSLKMAHKRCYGAARIYIENLRHLAINHPESHLFLQLDDMGKAVTFILSSKTCSVSTQ